MRRGRDPSRTPSRAKKASVGTIQEDSCQELASVLMEKISTEGISMEVQLKESVGTVLEGGCDWRVII